MPKKCKVCSGEKYVPCTGRPGYVECMFCGTVYSNDEIEETVSEEKKSIDLINTIGKGVCEIVWTVENCMYQGTGWYIGNGNVITNAHVVLDGQGYLGHKLNCKFTYLGKDAVYIGEAEKLDQVNDVAVVKINDDERLKPHAVKLAENPQYTIGQTVYTIGNTVGRGLSPQKGMISRLDDMEFSEGWKKLNAVPLLRTTLNVDHGNSGGPLINSKGEAIGLMSSGHVQESEVSIYSQTGRMDNVVGVGSIKVDELSIAVRLICVKNLLNSEEIYKEKQRPQIEAPKNDGLVDVLLTLQISYLPSLFLENFDVFSKMIQSQELFCTVVTQLAQNVGVKYECSEDDFIIKPCANGKSVMILYPDMVINDNLSIVQVFSLTKKKVYGVLPAGILVEIKDGQLYKIQDVDLNNLENIINNL